VESYKIQLFLHIAAAIVAFGCTFAFPFVQAAAERAGVAPARAAMLGIERATKFLVVPGAILVFLFGLGLIFDDQTGYKDDFPGWLMVAIPWYAIMLAVGALVQDRTIARARKLLDATPDGPDLPAEYLALSKRLQMVGGLLSLSVIGVTFLMVWKPGE